MTPSDPVRVSGVAKSYQPLLRCNSLLMLPSNPLTRKSVFRFFLDFFQFLMYFSTFIHSATRRIHLQNDTFDRLVIFCALKVFKNVLWLYPSAPSRLLESPLS